MLEITEIPVDGWEKVVRGHDPETGLRAFIAVHDTTLGPALGGLRMWNYATEKEALEDVLRLSRGMTYKSAVAQTGLGGGKSVIIGDPHTDKSPALYHSMGRFIDSLGGLYITAEDVGTTVDDLDEIAKTTRWVTGRRVEDGGSGNPSPYTAYGVFLGQRACLDEVFGTPKFGGRKFAVQGLGSVAQPLVRRLLEHGAKVVACDVDPERVEQVRSSMPEVEIVDPESIYDVECDVFAPCALGAVINDETLPRLRAKIVAGAANNQLLEDRHAAELMKRGILYAPDYVINAGGIINVSCEFDEGGYDEARSLRKIENIYDALKEIFRTAREQGITTAEAADHLAEQRLAEARVRQKA